MRLVYMYYLYTCLTVCVLTHSTCMNVKVQSIFILKIVCTILCLGLCFCPLIRCEQVL